eukprot:59084_1
MGTTTSTEGNNSNVSEKKEITEHLNNNERQRNICSSDINNCNHAKYFIKIINEYAEMELNKFDDNTSKLIEDIAKILDAYHHCLCSHNTYNKVNICSVHNCTILSRNNRNRNTTRNNNKFKQIYHTTNIQLISKLQILDKIHCYYSHSDHLGYRKPHNEQIIDDEKQINENYHTRNNKFHQLLSDP